MIDESIKECLNSKVHPEATTMPIIFSNIRYRLSGKLKDFHDEYIELETEKLNIYVKDFIADHQINWHEIASHYDVEINNILDEVLAEQINSANFDHSWND